MRLLGLLLILFATSAFADNGLVVHFTIDKLSTNETATYTNGVLMRLTEASTLTFPGQYEMRIESRKLIDGQVNLVVTLKDISGADPIYAGSGATTLKVGASQTLPLHQLQNSKATYKIFLDTSYGELPASLQ